MSALPEQPTTAHTGVVYRKSTGIYIVNSAGRLVTCTLSNRLRKALLYPIADPSSLPHRRVQAVEDIQTVDPVAIGDEVHFVEAGGDAGQIIEVLPRRSQLSRRAPGAKPLEQVVVANPDQVIPVVSAAQPKPRWGMIDRYLVSAAACDLPAIVCVTKLDALDEFDAYDVLEVVEDYRRIGYRVILTSAADGSGLDEFRDALAGRLSVLVGMSGVGKTTLLNAVQPGLGLRVGAINLELDKGRHTTTHLELFPLETGGAVVDTPGMKVFGLWDVDQDDIALLFPEMAEHVGRCRYKLDCTHDHEPGCAIKQAVAAGRISARRYHNYLSIRAKPHADIK